MACQSLFGHHAWSASENLVATQKKHRRCRLKIGLFQLFFASVLDLGKSTFRWRPWFGQNSP